MEPLIAAIAAMWSAFMLLGGGAFLHLKEQVKTDRSAAETREAAMKLDYEGRITRLEAKLDDSTTTIRKQAESQQAQVVSQQAMITTLQGLLLKSEVAP